MKNDETPTTTTTVTTTEKPILGRAAFYGIIGQMVDEIEPHTEADTVAVLVQLVTAVGNVVGRNPHVCVEADRHGTNVYSVLVGQSSKGRKGTSWGYAEKILNDIDPDWVRQRVKSGLGSGEGLINAVRDNNGSEGPVDKRCLILESEFAQLLKIMSRSGNIISPVVRNGWDSKKLETLVKNQPLSAENPHISIIGHITADELTRTLSSTEVSNGFGNRFLFFLVERSKLLPTGGRFRDEYPIEIVKCLKHFVDVAKKSCEFKLSGSAEDLWIESYPNLSSPCPGVYGALVARTEAQVLRWALNYAVVDEAKTIQVDHLLAAMEVVNYSRKSVQILYGKLSGDDIYDTLEDELLNAPNGLTRTDFRNLFNRNKSSAEVMKRVEKLEAEGKARNIPQGSSGRRVDTWFSPDYAKDYDLIATFEEADDGIFDDY